MFQKLVNHNDDIRQLIERGYAVAFDSNYLVVHDIPYLDNEGHLQIGTIVTKLVFVNDVEVHQDNHQILFAGSTPHGLDGKPIPNLNDSVHSLALSQDLVIQRAFSNKPRKTGRFQDFFDKIESYVSIISGPAIALHDVTPYTFRQVDNVQPNSVFKFQDTLTSRAEINDLSMKFNDDTIAIIGLGGTGAYVLDFLVKTPVREIRGFDSDPFHVHNSFRSPGRLEGTELGQTKAAVYHARYDNFRTGLRFEAEFIDDTSKDCLDGVTFAFVCVDKGTSRKGIFDILTSMDIPFIDVGMGLNRKMGPIGGLLRTSYYSNEESLAASGTRLAPMTDNPDDIYQANIQISELNALNACLAVIRFKQLRGFYVEEISYDDLLFGINDLSLDGSHVIED